MCGGISRRFRRVAVQPDNRRITNINLLFTGISSRPRGQGGEKQINKNNADCPLGGRRTSVISRILRVGDPPLPPPHMCKCGYGAPRRCAGRAPHCMPPYTRSRAARDPHRSSSSPRRIPTVEQGPVREILRINLPARSHASNHRLAPPAAASARPNITLPILTYRRRRRRH